MRVEQRDQERKKNEEYSKLMLKNAEQARNWASTEAKRVEEMRKKEEEA